MDSGQTASLSPLANRAGPRDARSCRATGFPTWPTSPFRGFGISTYLSVNFASPIALGDPPTADPGDESVAAWWAGMAERLYREIPDFGGFVVKANSESRQIDLRCPLPQWHEVLTFDVSGEQLRHPPLRAGPARTYDGVLGVCAVSNVGTTRTGPATSSLRPTSAGSVVWHGTQRCPP